MFYSLSFSSNYPCVLRVHALDVYNNKMLYKLRLLCAQSIACYFLLEYHLRTHSIRKIEHYKSFSLAKSCLKNEHFAKIVEPHIWQEY